MLREESLVRLQVLLLEVREERRRRARYLLALLEGFGAVVVWVFVDLIAF